MTTNRLEAFSDGVLAIIVTIMVLELKVPEGHEWGDIQSAVPGLLTYLLSFLYVAIYWVNHHHMFQVVDRVSGPVLWANNALLFSLSLIPFTTAWLDESHAAQVPVTVFGVNLLFAALCYYGMTRIILRSEPEGSLFRRATEADVKGRISMVIYIVGIVLSFWMPLAAVACFVVVAFIWLIPDRRIERLVVAGGEA